MNLVLSPRIRIYIDDPFTLPPDNAIHVCDERSPRIHSSESSTCYKMFVPVHVMRYLLKQ